MSEEIKEINSQDTSGNYFTFDTVNNNNLENNLDNIKSDYKLEISINSENKEKIQKMITNLKLTDCDIKITQNLKYNEHNNENLLLTNSTSKNNTFMTNKYSNYDINENKHDLENEQSPLKSTCQQTEKTDINKCISCEKSREKNINFCDIKMESYEHNNENSTRSNLAQY